MDILIKEPMTSLQKKFNSIIRAFKNNDTLCEIGSYGFVGIVTYYTNDNEEYIEIFNIDEAEYYIIHHPKALNIWRSSKNPKNKILIINSMYIK